MKNKKIDLIVITLFILIEMILYLSFLLLDFNIFESEINSSYLKFSGIIVCFVFSLIFGLLNFSKIKIFIPVALIFTLISDLFLLFSNENIFYIPGLITFTIAQLIYFGLISYKRRVKLEIIINFIIRIILSLMVIIVSFFLNYFDLLTILALIYFVQLAMNFVYSLFLVKQAKKYIVFSAGLFLFILCDINVGLNNVHLFPNIDYQIINLLMRIFYLPSQTLLTLSNYIFDDKKVIKC